MDQKYSITTKKDSFYEVIAELLFALIPLMVLALNRFFTGDAIVDLLSKEELSFISAVLFGQAIVKFVARAEDNGIPRPALSLIVTLILVLVVLSLFVLSWALNASDDARDKVAWAQVPLFVISIIVFLFSEAISYADANVVKKLRSRQNLKRKARESKKSDSDQFP